MLSAGNNRNAIYLCEQAAEKVIRAVLTSERVHAGVRHQLDEMVGRYTTPTGRIPDDPPPAEVEANITAIEAALNEAARRLGVELAAADKPATTSSPIR